MERVEFRIARTWDGEPIPVEEAVYLVVSIGRTALSVEIDAPFHDDPPPPGPAGPTDGLWDYEVVELFLLGADARYLELEFGPHGHSLGLVLSGVRHRVAVVDGVAYETTRSAGRWRGRARLSATWLPPGLRAGNAFAIHGEGPERRHLAASPVPGESPDFHRIDCFPPLTAPAGT